MSFEYNPHHILGVWENDNFPPYFINDNLEIFLNLKDEFTTSLITLKNEDKYTNYAMKFIQMNTNGIDKVDLVYEIFNGDNINQSVIGTQITLECNLYLGFPETDTMVCKNELIGKRMFKKKL